MMGKRKYIYLAVFMGLSTFSYGCDTSYKNLSSDCVTSVLHPEYKITNSIEGSRGLQLLSISKLDNENESIFLDKQYSLNDNGQAGLYLKDKEDILNKNFLSGQSITLQPELYSIGYWIKEDSDDSYVVGDYFPEFQFNFENTTQLGAKSYCTVTVKANTVTYQTYIDYQDTWEKHLASTNKYPQFKIVTQYFHPNKYITQIVHSSLNFTTNEARSNLVYLFQGGGMSKAIEPIQRIYGDLDGFKAFASDDDVSKAEVDIPISSCISQKNETGLKIINNSGYTLSNLDARVQFNLINNVKSVEGGSLFSGYLKHEKVDDDITKNLKDDINVNSVVISKDKQRMYYIENGYPHQKYLVDTEKRKVVFPLPIPMSQIYLDEDSNKTYFGGPYGILVVNTLDWGEIDNDSVTGLYDRTNGLASNTVHGIQVANGGKDIYAATDNGLSVSHNAGESWETVSSGEKISAVATLKSGNEINMLSGRKVYSLTGSNGRWREDTLGASNDISIRQMVPMDNVLYVASSKGVLFRDDNNVLEDTGEKGVWYQLTKENGLISNDIKGLAKVNHELYVVTDAGVNVVRVGEDYGDLLSRSSSPNNSMNIVLKASTKLAYDKDYIISGITLSNGNQSYNNVTLKATADESGNHIYNCTITQNGKAIVNQYGTAAIRCVAGVSELGATISIF